jgi:hypothetical protein
MSFQENMFVTRPQLQGMKSTHPKTFQSIRAGIAALTLAATSVANTPPPLVDFPSSIPAALDRATAKPVDDLMMGTMSVKLEATSLATIRDAIGVGRIQNQGDASESPYWLCYTAGEGRRRSRVWIESSGEMGGSDHAVTGVAAEFINTETQTPDCPLLPSRFGRLVFSHGVWLGDTIGAVTKALGIAPTTMGSWLYVGFEGKVPGQCEGGFDLLNSIAFQVQSGRVMRIQVNQVTSC